jgi:hypothetical protein
MFPSEDKRRNAFEDHIQSEGFDVSQLGAPNPFVGIRERVNTLLNSLPQPLDYRLYEEELDETQKQLCAYVAEAVADRYIKPTLSEQQATEIGDDDLHMVVMITVAMSMIAQQRLYIPTSEAPARPILKPIMPVEVPPPPKPVAKRTLWGRITRRLARMILWLLRQN